MIDNTINDDKTIASGGEGAILVRSLRCMYSLSLIIRFETHCVRN